MMGGKNNNQGASSHKRAASDHSQDGRQPPNRIAGASDAEEKPQETNPMAREVDASVRASFGDAISTNINQYSWQATALPNDIPAMLAKVEKDFRATFKPDERHSIYVKYSSVGSGNFSGFVRTKRDTFNNDVIALIDQPRRDHPNKQITVMVVIYASKRDRGNVEQRQLFNASRYDIAMADAATLQGLKNRISEQGTQNLQLQEALKDRGDDIDAWKEKAISREREVSDLKAKLTEKDREIAALNLNRNREGAIERVSRRMIEGDKKELQSELDEANLKIKNIEDKVLAMELRDSGEVANLQTMLRDRDQTLASAKMTEERLRQKLKELLNEKYARKLEELEKERVLN